VFWGLIHRMILVELLKIFFIALIVLTGLILMAGILAEAIKNGVNPVQIVAAIPLMIPSMLPYTVPTTTLFATCIVYGRLSADNEVLALKAAGIHIVHVIWPALFLGLAASIVTIILFLDTIPYTQYLLRTHVAGDVEDLLYAMLRKDGYIKHPKINYEIHVKNMQGRKLYDVLFLRRNGDGFDIVAKAREAELQVVLSEHKIQIKMRQTQVVQGTNVIFDEERTWPIELPHDFPGALNKSRALEMTWTELDDFEGKMHKDKKEFGQQIDMHVAAISQGVGKPHFDDHVKHLINERRKCDVQLVSIEAERHMRPAFALGCLCFALIGCPVGIWFSKSDYLSAFITCFLPIVTIYYPVMLCVINLSRAGKIPPLMAMYSADALMLIAGLVLFRRLTRN
jgi:lipopolysaccharide export system permease protein